MSDVYQNMMFSPAKMVESSMVASYLRGHPEQLRITKEVIEAYNILIGLYGDLLPVTSKSDAWGSVFGALSAKDYALSFRCILMNSYHVFDKTHMVYPKIIERVREYNPSWEEYLVKDYERKMRVCKVPIYIGTQ